MARTIALIAHDRQKDAMINFAIKHAPLLARYHLIATEGTGELIRSATKLKIECLESGSMGGDIQIANLVVAKLFFLLLVTYYLKNRYYTFNA
jgi:methylglyoxal synthase